MRYFLVTELHTSQLPGKTYHGPFSSRKAAESAAIAALATALFSHVQVEEDKKDEEGDEDEDEG